MFQRKHNLSFVFRMRALFWPEKGWNRRFRYIKHRVVREAASSYGVSAGLASGICVSFTPFIGLHMLLAWGYCKAVRGNVLAAMVGTLAGNPATFPAMFYLSYKVGAAILSSFDWRGSLIAPDQDLWANMLDQPLDFLQQNLHDIFLPTMVGGSVLAFGLFPFAFALCYPVGRAAKALNAQRRKRRWKKTHKDLVP